jgi:hypothetical protein
VNCTFFRNKTDTVVTITSISVSNEIIVFCLTCVLFNVLESYENEDQNKCKPIYKAAFLSIKELLRDITCITK